MLLVESARGPVVVKDYGRRPAWVRRGLAPRLVAHELAMLERAEGLPGVPRPLGRVGPLALAMEYVEGIPLVRRALYAALPPAFFDALEGILDGLALRGIVYLDLRSPTNVLATPSLAPALVDLGSAFRLPVPGALRRSLEGAALRKLRSRFQARGGEPAEPPRSESVEVSLKLGATRLALHERGPLADAVPALLLHDVGHSGAVFEPVLARAAQRGRRAIAVDLPGFGHSRWGVRTLSPHWVSRCLERLLDALRLERVDVVGSGWGGLAARALAHAAPERVRRLVLLESPPIGAPAERWRRGVRDPEWLRARIREELPLSLAPDVRRRLEWRLELLPARSLRLAAREVAHRLDRVPPPRAPFVSLGALADCLEKPDLLLDVLAG